MSCAVGVSPHTAERVLLIRLSALGDVVNTLAVLPLVRRRWPRAHLAFLTAPPWAELLAGDPLVDEVLVHRRAPLRLGLPAAMARMRGGRFDVVVDLQSSRYSRWLAWATAAPVRVGGRRGPWYTHVVEQDSRGHRALAHFLGLLRPLGVEGVPAPRVPDPARARREAEPLLAAHGLEEGVYAVLNPGHSPAWGTKRWPVRHWAALAGRLARAGLRPVLTGAGADRPLAREIASASDAAVTDLTGRTGLHALYGVMAGAAVVVSTDSGPMHVAAMSGTPVVALFGPTDPVPSGPWGEGHVILTHPVPCAPCFRKRCPYDHACLDRVAPDEVARAALAAAGRAAATPSAGRPGN